jgi:hypothetical protein
MWGNISTPQGPCSYCNSPYHYVRNCPTAGQFSNYSFEHMNKPSLDREMNFILIFITRHGATSLTSRGKLKIMESMLHKVMNCTISHIRSSMINHIPLNIKQLHSNNTRLHRLLGMIRILKTRCYR